MHQLLTVLGEYSGSIVGQMFLSHICMNLATSTETLHSSVLSFVTLRNLSALLAYNYSVHVTYVHAFY